MNRDVFEFFDEELIKFNKLKKLKLKINFE